MKYSTLLSRKRKSKMEKFFVGGKQNRTIGYFSCVVYGLHKYKEEGWCRLNIRLTLSYEQKGMHQIHCMPNREGRLELMWLFLGTMHSGFFSEWQSGGRVIPIIEVKLTQTLKLCHLVHKNILKHLPKFDVCIRYRKKIAYALDILSLM